MPGRLEFWRGLEAALRSGRPAFVARVVESTAHSPGTSGAALYATPDAPPVGTVGGGAMELRLLERARTVLGTGERVRELVDLHHRRDAPPGGEPSGMICAGRQTNLYLTLTPAEAPEVAAWTEALSAERGVLRTYGAGLTVLRDGGDGPPRLERGAAWRFDEPALERRRLAILGAGHCGRALARLMAGMGWRVRLFDTRRAMLEDPGAADLDVRRVDDFRDAGAAVDHARLTPVVVMTTDVVNDIRALAGALPRPFPMVGAMGSAAKLEEIRRQLGGLGLGAADLERLTAPVGLEIDSHTPAEIAVSVGAQLLARRHRWLDAAGPDSSGGG
ncbi:MAG: XdhC/CoxI family protein [Acidobacteriota bacterium]